jgi:pimeloyl-ACP methyl ester carboxylesterase
MVSAMERAVGVAIAVPLVWLGACAESAGGNSMMEPGIGVGGTPSAGAGGTFGASGMGAGPAPIAGMGSAAGMTGGGGMGMPSPAGLGGSGTGGTTGGAGGMAGDDGMAGMAGTDAMAGAGGMGAAGGDAGAGTGTCCADGNCLCRDPEPTGVTSSAGPFDTASFRVSTGTVYYPTDAEPPFAGVAICGGFLNTGPEMESWGPFYASHGIVTIITTTTGADIPDIRAVKLLAAIESLKAENTKSGSELFGKMSDRYGTSGYSMGGGGTTIASAEESTLKTSVGLAPWAPVGAGIQVPTLLLCGSSDGTAPCSMAQSSYRSIPEATPKMMISISGASHFSWFGPGDAGRGTSGAYALAFQKVYLEGDERWKPFLLESPSGGTATTNIQ